MAKQRQVTPKNIDMVVQHIEYVPFGEVFLEERNNTWNTPYLFNGKELDEETGLYYYGARYYNSKTSQFISTDRFTEKYPYASPYQYCLNNPINAIDVNGDSLDVSNGVNYDIANGTNYMGEIKSDLMEQTGLTLSINNGMLEYEKDNDGNAVVSKDSNGNAVGSFAARETLKKSIDDISTATFSLVTSSGSEGQGLNFRLDINEVHQFINGASPMLNNKTMGFGMIFLHEILHTDVGIGVLHGSEVNIFGQTGTVVDYMNNIRSQLGSDYGIRTSYLGWSENARTYIPFDVRSGNILSNRIQYLIRMKNSYLPRVGFITPSPHTEKFICY